MQAIMVYKGILSKVNQINELQRMLKNIFIAIKYGEKAALIPASISNLDLAKALRLVKISRVKIIDKVNLRYFIFKRLLKGVIMIHILAPILAFAIDFGIVGQTFKVTEESFVAMLKKRLDTVDIEKEQQKIQAQAKARVENPVPVSEINPATKDRVFYFDPSYTLDKDVVLPCGKILHKAGTKVNPLEHMDLSRRLFFIDGRHKDQIAWLKEQLNTSLPKQEEKEPIETRVILVGGSVFKVKDELGEFRADKVYFDQAGELTSKFGIKASPAIAEQEGLKIKIEEVNLMNYVVLNINKSYNNLANLDY